MTEVEVERRALRIYERLTEGGVNPRLRERLLRREPPAVVARVTSLERSGQAAARSMPTQFPGEGGGAIEPPDRIGPFRLDAQIGEGGMGQVWRGVRDDGLYDQIVAVKLIHPDLAAIASDRFDAERRILARLEHPGIARLIDGGVTAGGLPYLIMEFVDGAPIDLACEGRPLRERVKLFLSAAEAVAFAHSRLVVHADLKPSNILVTAGDWVKLLDFGIAHLLDEGRAAGEAGEQPMTRAFASPGRIAGAAPTISDDVYALGLILKGLTGTDGEADLAAIAAKASAPEETSRYASVSDLIADLGRWQGRFPVLARRHTPSYRAARLLARHPWGIGLTAAAFVALSATSIVATSNYYSAEAARVEASARFDDARGTSRYLLYQLSDQLERQPNTLPLRAEVARVSQHYLTRLADSPNAPAEVRREAAEGLIRLAERLGAPGRPNLGQAEIARANLDRALALLGDDRSAAAARLKVLALIARSQLEAHTFSELPAAEASLLAAARTLNGEPRIDLRPQFLTALASVRMVQGRYVQAIQYARAAAEPAQAPLDHAGLSNQALAAEVLGDALYYDDQFDAGVRAYRASIALWESFLKRFPGDPLALRRLPRARYSLSAPLLGEYGPGGIREAERVLARAVAEAEAASATEPRDAESLRQVMILRGAHAQSIAMLGQPDRAIPILERLIEWRRGQWQAAPGETRRMRDYIITIAMLADIEADAGREGPACSKYAEVVRLFGELAKADRHVQLDEDYSLRLVRERQARHCRA